MFYYPLPSFPVFRNIALTDQELVESFTSTFLPFSDFNFTSLCVWNTTERMGFSLLNGNLVVLFYDYLTKEPFISFIGKHKVTETAVTLLNYSLKEFGQDTLRLIPKSVAEMLCLDQLTIVADPDAHDYILSVAYLRNLDTFPVTSHHGAYECKRFIKMYPTYSVKDQILNDSVYEEVLQLFIEWGRKRNIHLETFNEFNAFKNLLAENYNNKIVSLHYQDKMIAFSTYEIHSHEYAFSHFGKADTSYIGCYSALFHEVGKILNQQGIKYWNIEQDLGIPELRMSKRKYKPEFLLEKFIVSTK